MKTINKFNLKNGVLAAAVMVFGATACTSNFEELNTGPDRTDLFTGSASRLLHAGSTAFHLLQSNKRKLGISTDPKP